MSTLAATIGRGTNGSRPAAGEAGRLYYDTTNSQLQRDNGSSWDVCEPTSLTNPMTTAGDIIVGGSSGTPGRLAVGAAGTVLAGGTTPAWIAGGLVQISDNLLAGTAASFDLTSIPGSYKSLEIVLLLASDQSANQAVTLRLNNDSGSNYDYHYYDPYGATTSIEQVESYGATSISVADAIGTSFANVAVAARIRIPNYATTTFQKSLRCDEDLKYQNSTPGIRQKIVSGFWRNTAAITRVTLTPATGNFAIGSRCTLYGLG